MSGKPASGVLVFAALLGLALPGCWQRARPPAGPPPAPQVTVTPRPQQQPTPPQKPAVARKARFVIGTPQLTPPIAQITINGPPADREYAAPYELVEVSGVEGTAPAVGPYYLLRAVGQKQGGGGIGMSGDPLLGPLFLERLSEGVRLSNLVPLGTFQAKPKGYLGKGIGNKTLISPQQYTFVEASVEGP